MLKSNTGAAIKLAVGSAGHEAFPMNDTTQRIAASAKKRKLAA